MAPAQDLLSHPPRLPMIFPSILGADFGHMADGCADVLELGAEALHVDVMDGHFVPNLTMGPKMVADLRRAFPDVFLDVHLMVTNPENFVEPFAKAGADCLSFHIEVTAGRAEHDEQDLIRRIRGAGCAVGIVINPPTPADAVFHVLESVDMVLVMSVNPGFSGQSFIPDVLDKTRAIGSRLPQTVRLQMDGGIGLQTVQACRDAGCDTIVAASALFGAEDRKAVMQALRGHG
ncbi:MAG: ribulose-phosphate 3-epimerase [Phycisphaerae bacterium]|nr:ribulose-phosphate 3-epimerase [Phycisphaerae bacterium]